MPAGPILPKGQVRDTLRAMGREEDWIHLQGYVYGPGMTGVDPFPGVAEALRALANDGVEVFVISHKTRPKQKGLSLGPSIAYTRSTCLTPQNYSLPPVLVILRPL